MSNKQHAPPVPRRSGRAARAALALVTLACAAACAALLNIAAGHRPARFDLTTAGQHRLSEASRRVVSRLDGMHRVVLAVDAARADRAVLERVRDVMDSFAAARPGAVEAVFVDLADAAGARRAAELVASLAAEDAEALDAAARLAETCAVSLERAAGDLRGLGTSLERLREQIPETAPGAANNRAWAEQRAAMCRVLGDELAGMAESARGQMTERGPGHSTSGGIAPVERVIGPARAGLARADVLLAALAADAGALSGGIGDGARDTAARIARGAKAARDSAAATADAAARWRPPDALLAARAIEAGEAMLVLGPPGQGHDRAQRPAIVRIEPAEMLPDAASLARAGVSAPAYAGEQAEGLIAAALAQLGDEPGPVVVFAHGEAQTGLLASPLAAQMVDRLERQGIAVVEWPAAAQPQMPSLSQVDPSGLRPVVVVTLAPDTAAGSVPGKAGSSGADRARALAAAVGAELGGEPTAGEGGGSGRVRGIVLSLGPSVFLGDDPLAAIARSFGVEAGVTTPLLREEQGEGGRTVRTELPGVGGGGSEHPVGQAVRGQRVLLPWPVALTPDGTAAAVVLLDAPGVWGESQWLGLWQTPRAQRGLRPELLPRQDSPRDLPIQTAATVVVAAAEQPRTGVRAVVVGSNGWMLDPVAGASENVDGRVVRSNRGNWSLLDAAVRWAARQDDRVAPAPEADATPTIRELSAGELSAVRWGLVAGVPLGVLLAGLAWRLLRG